MLGICGFLSVEIEQSQRRPADRVGPVRTCGLAQPDRREQPGVPVATGGGKDGGDLGYGCGRGDGILVRHVGCRPRDLNRLIEAHRPGERYGSLGQHVGLPAVLRRQQVQRNPQELGVLVVCARCACMLGRLESRFDSGLGAGQMAGAVVLHGDLRRRDPRSAGAGLRESTGQGTVQPEPP